MFNSGKTAQPEIPLRAEMFPNLTLEDMQNIMDLVSEKGMVGNLSTLLNSSARPQGVETMRTYWKITKGIALQPWKWRDAMEFEARAYEYLSQNELEIRINMPNKEEILENIMKQELSSNDHRLLEIKELLLNAGALATTGLIGACIPQEQSRQILNGALAVGGTGALVAIERKTQAISKTAKSLWKRVKIGIWGETKQEEKQNPISQNNQKAPSLYPKEKPIQFTPFKKMKPDKTLLKWIIAYSKQGKIPSTLGAMIKDKYTQEDLLFEKDNFTRFFQRYYTSINDKDAFNFAKNILLFKKYLYLFNKDQKKYENKLERAYKKMFNNFLGPLNVPSNLNNFPKETLLNILLRRYFGDQLQYQRNTIDIEEGKEKFYYRPHKEILDYKPYKELMEYTPVPVN